MKVLHTYIQCDGASDQCQGEFGYEHREDGRKIKDIRADAKQEGWVYYNRSGELPKDLCPACKPKRK